MPLTRSEQMARIRPAGTTPERLLAAALEAAGHAPRQHVLTAAGRADLGFPDELVAVYVDGCFFHGCPDHYVRPRSRGEFWSRKLAGNVARDIRQTAANRAAGWRVVRLWECEVREDAAACAERVAAELAGAPSASDMDAWRVGAVEVVDEATDAERRRLVSLWDPERREDRVRVRTTRKHGRAEGG